MPNQYKNKVVFNGNTLIDISDTTAVESDVASGKEFYLASGAKVQGTQQLHGIEKTLVNILDINQETQIAHNGLYYNELTPQDGYFISSISVYMGNTDISATTISGSSSRQNRGVVKIYSNVTDTNSADQVVSNAMYYNELTSQEGYYIASVTVTMGDADISKDVVFNGD